ncbi:MAG: hypothetical protein ACE5WD_14370 [Candidatus Aminicenantia bacterium]
MEYKKGVLTKTLPGSSATIPEIYFWKNEFILVPIFSPDRAENFLDIYNPEANLVHSYIFPVKLYEKGKGYAPFFSSYASDQGYPAFLASSLTFE